MAKQDSPITVGGAYQEDKDFVPEATDMVAQFNTSGLGAHARIEEVSPIFEVDKVKTAAEIAAALDPDNDAVPSSRVILPNLTDDNDVAREEILEVAEARLKKGVVIGGPTPAQREAELSGDEGVLAAVEQERSNAAANSTGNRAAGRHEGTASTEAGRDETSTVPQKQDKGSSTTSSTSSDAKGDDDGELKGEALEQALTDRDLPHTGTADEKRARVKEYDDKQG